MPPPSLFLRSQGKTSRVVRPAIVAGVCCIFLRIWSLYRVTGSTFVTFPDGDPRYYLEWALRISQGTWTDGQAFFGLPLYPYWLALLFTVFGKGVYIPLVIQCIADAILAAIITSLSSVILAKTGAQNSNIEKTDLVRGPDLAWWLAIGAGVGWADYQPAQAYAVTLMPTTIAALCFWLVVRWIVMIESIPTAGLAAGVGVGLGIVATLVANILILVPLIVLRFGLLGTLTARRWLGAGVASLLLLVGIVVGTSPCWIHNYFIAKEPVVFSAHGGINFYLGNQPGASGYPKMPPSMDASQSGLREDSQRIPEEAMGRKLTRTEAGAYWNALAKQAIRQDPARWLGLLARKLRNYWNAFQYDDISVISAMSDSGLIAPGPRFGLLAMLGIPGLIAGCLMARPIRWVAGAVTLQMISLLPVFVTERYRLAAVPGLLIGASVGLYWCWRWIGAAEWGRLLRGYLAPLVLSIWLVTLPTKDPSLWALDLYNSARVLLANGETERAGERATQALALAPGNPEIQFLLGNYWLEKGDRSKARSLYQATLRGSPNHARAWNNLGVVEIQAERWEDARTVLTNASRISPGDARIHYLLARAAQGLGDWPAADSEIHTALTLQPERPEFNLLEKEIVARQSPRKLSPNSHE